MTQPSAAKKPAAKRSVIAAPKGAAAAAAPAIATPAPDVPEPDTQGPGIDARKLDAQALANLTQEERNRLLSMLGGVRPTGVVDVRYADVGTPEWVDVRDRLLGQLMDAADHLPGCPHIDPAGDAGVRVEATAVTVPKSEHQPERPATTVACLECGGRKRHDEPLPIVLDRIQSQIAAAPH